MATTKKTTDGSTTSEFKMALTGYAVGIAMATIGILVTLGAIPANVAESLKPQVGELITAIGGAIVGLSSMGYSIGRGLAKKG